MVGQHWFQHRPERHCKGAHGLWVYPRACGKAWSGGIWERRKKELKEEEERGTRKAQEGRVMGERTCCCGGWWSTPGGLRWTLLADSLPRRPRMTFSLQESGESHTCSQVGRGRVSASFLQGRRRQLDIATSDFD